jgi:hypothetical protein
MSKLFVPDLTKGVTHACRGQCDTLPRREWVSLKVGQSSCGLEIDSEKAIPRPSDRRRQRKSRQALG